MNWLNEDAGSGLKLGIVDKKGSLEDVLDNPGFVLVKAIDNPDLWLQIDILSIFVLDLVEAVLNLALDFKVRDGFLDPLFL